MYYINSIWSFTKTNTPEKKPSLWESKGRNCHIDLTIKQLAIALITLLNFAALGVGFYYLVAYCTIPAQAMLISPFIVGVLAALANLKFPTFGISSGNYSNFLNPLALVGRVAAYVFFGPMMYILNKVDLTPYHDPIKANKVSQDLEELSFEKIADQYGPFFQNLIKYGFIHEKYEQKLQSLYETYVPIKEEILFWKNEGLENCVESKTATRKKLKVEKDWKALKESFEYAFPHPNKPKYDFSKTTTSVQLKYREYVFSRPLHTLRRIQA
jgi:hypothetical protein